MEKLGGARGIYAGAWFFAPEPSPAVIGRAEAVIAGAGPPGSEARGPRPGSETRLFQEDGGGCVSSPVLLAALHDRG